MNKISKIALISFSLLILIIGISCASAANVNSSNTDSLHVKDQQSIVKINQPANNVKKLSEKAVSNKKIVTEEETVKPVDKIINGWNPKEHEVSRESLGDGLYRVNYDDGYFRIIDEDGNILSYGY